VNSKGREMIRGMKVNRGGVRESDGGQKGHATHGDTT